MSTYYFQKVHHFLAHWISLATCPSQVLELLCMVPYSSISPHRSPEVPQRRGCQSLYSKSLLRMNKGNASSKVCQLNSEKIAILTFPFAYEIKYYILNKSFCKIYPKYNRGKKTGNSVLNRNRLQTFPCWYRLYYYIGFAINDDLFSICY